MALRLKFGMPKTEQPVNTRIVVMEIMLDGILTVIGSLSDAAHDVMELDSTAIEEAPKIGAKWNSAFIKGIGKQDDQFIIILDVDRVFSVQELAMVKAKEPVAA